MGAVENSVAAAAVYRVSRKDPRRAVLGLRVAAVDAFAVETCRLTPALMRPLPLDLDLHASGLED